MERRPIDCAQLRVCVGVCSHKCGPWLECVCVCACQPPTLATSPPPPHHPQSVHSDVSLIRRAVVCAQHLSRPCLVWCQVVANLRLIIGIWRETAGGSGGALMKAEPWLIGDTVAWGSEGGSYQAGGTKRRGQRIRPPHRQIKLVTFICSACGASECTVVLFKIRKTQNLPAARVKTDSRVPPYPKSNTGVSARSSSLNYLLSRPHASSSPSVCVLSFIPLSW